MKKLLLFAAAILLSGLFSGCALPPVAPPRGVFYTHQRAPLFPSTQIGTSVGTASAHNVLFLVGWGDCSLATAAAQGGITSIKNTEYESRTLFFASQRFTTVVYGDNATGTPLRADAGRR